MMVVEVAHDRNRSISTKQRDYVLWPARTQTRRENALTPGQALSYNSCQNSHAAYASPSRQLFDISELKCPSPQGYGTQPVGLEPQGYEGKRSCLPLERRSDEGWPILTERPGKSGRFPFVLARCSQNQSALLDPIVDYPLRRCRTRLRERAKTSLSANPATVLIGLCRLLL
jgi:hypothetical protein